MKNIKYLCLPGIVAILCSMSPAQNNQAVSKILGVTLENVTNLLQSYTVINLGTVRETDTGTKDLVAEEFFKYEAFELKKLTPQYTGKFVYLVTEFKFNLNQECEYMCGFLNWWKGSGPVSHKTGTIGLKINNATYNYNDGEQTLLSYEDDYRVLSKPLCYGSIQAYCNQISYMLPNLSIYDISSSAYTCRFKTTASKVSIDTKGEYNYRINNVELDKNGSVTIKNAIVLKINDLINMPTIDIGVSSAQQYNLGLGQIGNDIHTYHSKFSKTISIKIV